MLWITNKYAWVPLYLYWGFVVVKNFPDQRISIFVAIAILILVTDQLTSGFMKPFFERPRPCYEPNLASVIHLMVNCGGKFGFASGHSANSFALATFIFAVMKLNGRSWFFIFLWAFLIALSRVYVGVHYPTDVIIGAIIGLFLGWLFFIAWKRFPYKMLSRL
ncbi:MAG: phosphatase PAP2 family protein [Bacteroidetes bacterium]|nr:phosphatase PAP2 family protein [Bacteroidota bacterium]MDA1121544.1 phosphatase PAP2 family protein [Bacteroidota bacterium]